MKTGIHLLSNMILLREHTKIVAKPILPGTSISDHPRSGQGT
jgi:hypothetical protein